MSKTSTALRRFGVGLLSAATMGAGLTAFAPVANAATADITGLTITPDSATISTGEDSCQAYTVKATESGTNTDGTVTIQLQPTGGVDSQFCDPGTNPAPTAGTKDSQDFVLGNDNEVTIGVNEANTAAGQIQIKAFPQNTTTPGTPANGAPVATALENINTADAQNDVVTQLASSPADSSGTEGDTVTYTVTATNGASSVVQDAYIYYTVTSHQGNSVGQDNVACNNPTDDLGQVECDVTVPATTSVQSGPYTVTFKAPHNATGEHNVSSAIPASNTGPTTTSTLSSIPQASNNSAVFLDCGTADTQLWSPSFCEDSGATRSETLTATVLQPASSSSTTATVPASGVEVTFHYGFGDTNGGGVSTFDPDRCVTGADGTCTVTLKRAADNTGNNAFDAVYAQIVTPGGTVQSYNGNGTDDYTYVDYGYYNFESPATNIAGSPDDTNASTGTTQTVNFAVMNQYGNPANETCFTDNYDLSQADGSSCDSLADPNAVSHTTIPVTVTITGAGTFTDGTTTKTVNVTDGTAQVAVTSKSAGTSTITGSLNAGSTDCTVEAPSNSNGFENDYFNYDPEVVADAGNCSDQVTVNWASSPPTGKQAMHLHLACFSHSPGKIKCVAQTAPAIKGLTVKFFNKKGKKVATDITNKAGKAHFVKTGKKSGKTYTFQAHLKSSATTYAADSKNAKVTVQ